LLSNISIGLDLGATQIEVDKYTIGADTFAVFHGKYVFPESTFESLNPLFLKKSIAIIGIVNATTFSSKNKNNAFYGGFDGAVRRSPVSYSGFGYISTGPMLYVIQEKIKAMMESKAGMAM
jgi:hypothetical protein